MTEQFSNKLLNENMYTSSLTFFRGIKASFKQCIKLVNLSSKCEWLLPAVALQNTTTARLLLSFSLLEDPNVDLTDNKLSLARNGLNVGVSAIRHCCVPIIHVYQCLFTVYTNLMLKVCNFLIFSDFWTPQNDYRKFQWPSSSVGLWKTVFLCNDLDLIIMVALKIWTLAFTLDSESGCDITVSVWWHDKAPLAAIFTWITPDNMGRAGSIWGVIIEFITRYKSAQHAWL